MFRRILTILLIVSLTVPLFAVPTNKSSELLKNGVSKNNGNMTNSTDSQRQESSKHNKTNSVAEDDYIDDQTSSNKEESNGGSDDLHVGHILKNDDDDGVKVDGKKFDVFTNLLVYFEDITETLNSIGHSLADGAHVAAGKIADISQKTHNAYLVSKDQFLRTEEKVANKAHDIFLYTQGEFDYVVEEMRKEVNRHALYIGLLSGICSYFLMFPVTFLLSFIYKKCCGRRNRLSFFCRKHGSENKPLLKKERGVGAIDFDL
uniref:PIR protein n=1 Tax=Strongyloides papillosus TaxID=174720 RepID=A0A0N5BXA4_STREA